MAILYPSFIYYKHAHESEIDSENDFMINVLGIQDIIPGNGKI